MSLQKYLAAGLGKRLVTGIILIAVVVTAWYFGGLPLFALLLAICVLGQWEFYSFFMKSNLAAKIFGILIGAALASVCFFFPQYPLSLSLTAAFALIAIHSLIGWTQEKSLLRFSRAAVLMSGVVYIPLLLAPVVHYTPAEQLLIVFIPALSDIAAYATGVQFGKHKIWPSVSPKKSVEGAFAGLLAATAACVIAGTQISPNFSFIIWAGLGLFMGIMAQMGDFFESALKRSVQIKDSGFILPGHGGVLDRIDSILFAAAAYTLVRPFLG